MKSKNTNGFTLVELIIVITILAILATIAFISFQSYTKDARNAKRSSDLNSISRAIEVKSAEGVTMMNFASDNTAAVNSISLAGGVTIGATNYKAGEINSTIIGATNNDSFKDPSKKVGYKIGVTTLAGGAYQIAAIKEAEKEEPLVVGTFKPRLATDLVTGTLDGSLKVITATAGLGILKKDDIISDGNVTDAKVVSVSSDLSTITVDKALTTGTTSFHITASESDGLIKDKTTDTTAVKNGGTALPY